MDEILSFGLEQAAKAGAVMREYFERTDKHVVQKANKTAVTDADKLINQQLIVAVTERYPKHGVLGEEASMSADRRSLWVCDPIDGTDAFIIGVPTAMFSLAYVVDGRVEVAVAHDPFLDRTFSAVRGRGTFLDGRRLRVSSRSELAGANVGSSASVNQLLSNSELFQSLLDSQVNVKGVPGVVYRGTLIAQGSLDGCIALGAAHDFAASSLLIQEAGGIVTDLDGQEQRYDGSVRGVVMSNGQLHQSLVDVVQRYGVDRFVGSRR